MTGPRKMHPPPFWADHVGSLLHPSHLLESRRKAGLGGVDEGPSKDCISAAELRNIEDECVREVAAMRESISLEGITDGKLQRASWAIDFLSAIEGITMTVPGSNTGMDFTRQVYCPPVPTIISKPRETADTLMEYAM